MSIPGFHGLDKAVVVSYRNELSFSLLHVWCSLVRRLLDLLVVQYFNIDYSQKINPNKTFISKRWELQRLYKNFLKIRLWYSLAHTMYRNGLSDICSTMFTFEFSIILLFLNFTNKCENLHFVQQWNNNGEISFEILFSL